MAKLETPPINGKTYTIKQEIAKGRESLALCIKDCDSCQLKKVGVCPGAPDFCSFKNYKQLNYLMVKKEEKEELYTIVCSNGDKRESLPMPKETLEHIELVLCQLVNDEPIITPVRLINVKTHNDFHEDSIEAIGKKENGEFIHGYIMNNGNSFLSISSDWLNMTN